MNLERRNPGSKRSGNDTVAVLVETAEGEIVLGAAGEDGVETKKIGSNICLRSNNNSFNKNGMEMNALTVVGCERYIAVLFFLSLTWLKGKGTGQLVLSTYCLGHFQFAAHYNFQSRMIERC